jgi:hypothetical protein
MEICTLFTAFGIQSALADVGVSEMRYRTLILLFLLGLALLAMLSACGGGSGGGY